MNDRPTTYLHVAAEVAIAGSGTPLPKGRMGRMVELSANATVAESNLSEYAARVGLAAA
jgi:hypothetical protein